MPQTRLLEAFFIDLDFRFYYHNDRTMQFCTDSYFSSEVKVYTALSHKIALDCTPRLGMCQASGAGRRMEKKTVDNNIEPRIKFL